MRNEFETNIKKVYLLNFISSFHLFSAVLVPFFTLWGRINFTQLMILQSIFHLTIVMAEVPTGVVADKIGRKHSLGIGNLIVAFAAIIYASYPSFYVFVVAEILFGIGVSFLSGAGEAFIYDTLRAIGKESISKRVFANANKAQLLGIGISAPVGSVVAHYFGLRAPMLLNSIPFFFAFLITLTMVEPRHYRKHDMTYLSILKRGVKTIKEKREVRVLAMDMVLVATLCYLYIWLYQPKLMQISFPIALFGVVHVFIILGEVAVLHLLERIEKLVGGKKNYLLVSAIIPAICFVLLAISTRWYVVIPAIITGMAFGMTRKTPMISYINKFVESEARATVISFITLARSLLISVVNPMVGKGMDVSLNATLLIVGLLLLITALASRIEEHMLLD